MAFNNQGAMGGAMGGAAIGANPAFVAATGGLSILGGAAVGGLMGGFMGGDGGGGPSIDISAEMARINALYEQARTQGSAAITQDFQAQRGELAQSQAARGILRSGVSQLGLARLGAARQQALAQFNAQLSAAQAGQGSSLLNALMGRKTALDESAFNRQQAGNNQLLGAGAGLFGSALQGGLFSGGAPKSQGFNFSGTNMVAPPTPQGFYKQEFGGGGYGAQNLTGSQMLGAYQAPGYRVIP